MRWLKLKKRGEKAKKKGQQVPVDAQVIADIMATSEAAFKLLQRLEWSGKMNGFTYCPACLGICPKHEDEPAFQNIDLHFGHIEGCELHRLIST
jgi:hypothetical protein